MPPENVGVGRMECPLCQESEMTAGRIKVKKALSGFLLFGFGWSDLYWEDANRQERVLLPHGDFALGWRCPSCEAVVTDPKGTREARKKRESEPIRL